MLIQGSLIGTPAPEECEPFFYIDEPRPRERRIASCESHISPTYSESYSFNAGISNLLSGSPDVSMKQRAVSSS